MTDPVLNAINAEVTVLTEQGAQHFDPYRFAYIEAMLKRSASKSANIVPLLVTKIQKALSEYQADFENAQYAASVVLDRIKQHYPNSLESANTLYQQAEFSLLTKQLNELERKSHPSELATLTTLITQSKVTSGDSAESTTFADLLQQQEGESGNQQSESNSIRRLRESWEQYNAEQLVNQAIKEGPENPGPINPHMLVIRSLSNMRDLSPHYLKRFIGYIDTLFWLEDTGK